MNVLMLSNIKFVLITNFRGVLAVGSAFAIRKEFFREIGMYDAGLKIWGGENLELSFKVVFIKILFSILF